MLILIFKWRATGASGQPGVHARVNVEDRRKGSGLVLSPHRVMEALTVMGNFSKLRRETALNVRITLTGILFLKVQSIFIY